MKKRILVTGAAGFLGGRTAKFLASYFTDYQVVCTSRRSDRQVELESSGCVFIPGDLCDPDFCESITEYTEIVVHCAAFSAPFGAYSDFYKSNVVATDELLKACKLNAVKQFIFISTPSIYFNYSDRFQVSESDALPKKMVNHYAQTKLIAEQIVLASNGNGIQTIALRPRAIIGAEDTVIFPRLLEAYHAGKLKIVGDGKNISDMTCVRNVIEAILCAINSNASAYGEAYNITDGAAVNFWEALHYALSALGFEPPKKHVPKQIALFAARILEWKAALLNETKEPPLTRYGVGVLANNFTLDISKAQSRLNYKAVMNTYEGINEYIAWHKIKH